MPLVVLMASIRTSIPISKYRSILPDFNPTKSLNLCLKDSSSSESIFCSRIVLRRSVSGAKGFWAQPGTLKINLIKSCALKERHNGDGRLEQDTDFLDGSSSESTPSSAMVFRTVESTINGVSKWITAIIVNVYILWRKDAETLWFALGCFSNMILSIHLKHLLNQERPSALKSDPGMPSSHAQTFYYITIFSIFSSMKRLGMNAFTITVSGLALAFGSYLSYLRVSEQFHTASQVVVGGGIGIAFGWSWFWIWNNLVTNVIESFLPLKLFLLSISPVACFAFTFYSFRQWLQQQRQQCH